MKTHKPTKHKNQARFLAGRVAYYASEIALRASIVVSEPPVSDLKATVLFFKELSQFHAEQASDYLALESNDENIQISIEYHSNKVAEYQEKYLKAKAEFTAALEEEVKKTWGYQNNAEWLEYYQAQLKLELAKSL